MSFKAAISGRAENIFGNSGLDSRLASVAVCSIDVQAASRDISE